MPITLSQKPTISQGDVDVVAIDYTEYLDSGESLTGSPTVTEQRTSDLTFANKTVSGATLTIRDKDVAAGKAVQFKVSGQKAGTEYRVRVSVGTNSSPARTCVRDILLRCV